MGDEKPCGVFCAEIYYNFREGDEEYPRLDTYYFADEESAVMYHKVLGTEYGFPWMDVVGYFVYPCFVNEAGLITKISDRGHRVNC